MPQTSSQVILIAKQYHKIFLITKNDRSICWSQNLKQYQFNLPHIFARISQQGFFTQKKESRSFPFSSIKFYTSSFTLDLRYQMNAPAINATPTARNAMIPVPPVEGKRPFLIFSTVF